MKKGRGSVALRGSGEHRFNVVDAVILLLAVVCVIGAVLRYGVIEKIEYQAGKTTATVSFLIEDVQEQSRDYLRAGDTVYLSSSDPERVIGTIGTVEEPTATPVYVTDDDGKIRVMPSDNGRVDIRGTLTVAGEMTDAGFYLDGTMYIAPNMTLNIRTATLSVSVLLTDIRPES